MKSLQKLPVSRPFEGDTGAAAVDPPPPPLPLLPLLLPPPQAPTSSDRAPAAAMTAAARGMDRMARMSRPFTVEVMIRCSHDGGRKEQVNTGRGLAVPGSTLSAL